MAEDRSMMDVMRGSRILAYSMGFLCLVIGVLILFRLEESVTFVAKIAGVLIAVVGISEVFEAITTHRKGSYWGLLLLRGAINVVLGVLLVGWPDPTLLVFVWIFGLDVVITGVVGIVASLRVPKELWRSALQFRSVVGIVFGVMIMAWPNVTIGVVAIIVGLQLVLAGLLLLFAGFQISRAEQDAT